MSKRKLQEAEIFTKINSNFEEEIDEIPDVTEEDQNEEHDSEEDIGNNKSKKKKVSFADISSFVQKLKEKKTINDKTWRNKQRVLVFCSRGASAVHRLLINDLRDLIPHSKSESKFDLKKDINVINEICELQSCNNCIFMDLRKADAYLWFAKTPHGPTFKFHLLNPHALQEFQFPGNCLKGSRPIVTFDKHFDEAPQWKLAKEMLSHMFSTPKGHPNSKPFIDHVISFYIQDNKIWFRNYQIVHKSVNKSKETELVEIGPRFTLEPVKVFAGSFGGTLLYRNPNFIPTSTIKQQAKPKKPNYAVAKYNDLVRTKRLEELTKEEDDPLMEVFKDK